jgi:hypothetical protein
LCTRASQPVSQNKLPLCMHPLLLCAQCQPGYRNLTQTKRRSDCCMSGMHARGRMHA